MPPRKELCRNFQRGSCQYGDRCKFLHASPQQSLASPFGFGTQTGNQFQRTNPQQQNPNPFGFGVQNNAQFRGPNDSGSNPNQFKPFENKWSRFSPLNTTNSSTSKQPNSQTPAPNHKCTDPESCRRVMIEDFEHERPLWKLTCYAHNKNAPCDVVGDTSYEELRALAYDEAKRGLSLQSIIERERILVNTKLVEFQNLVQKPYAVPPTNSTTSTQNPFASFNSPSPPTPIQGFAVPSTNAATSTQNPFSSFNSPSPPMPIQGSSPTVSGFGQLGASLNTSSMFGAPSSHTFGQSQPFKSNSNAFGAAQSFSFGQSHPFESNTGPSRTSQRENPSSTISSHMPTAVYKPSEVITSGANYDLDVNKIIQLMDDVNNNVDDSIWTKPGWKIGEIPEVPPPDNFIY